MVVELLHARCVRMNSSAAGFQNQLLKSSVQCPNSGEFAAGRDPVLSRI